MLEAYMSASTDITPMFGTVNACVRAKEPAAYAAAADMFKGRLKNYFKVWDDKLAKHKYAAGDEVTIADLSLYAGYWRTKGAFPELVGGMANLERWAAEINARPGVQRALKI
jgi:GST-like protein